MATERAEILRPSPESGDTIAAAAVTLTVLVTVVNFRFGAEWGQGIHLVYSAAATFAVVGMAAMSPRAGDRPAGWQSVLFVASFAVALLTLGHLADTLGADNPFNASGTIVWVGLLLIGLMAWFATGWSSGISTLLAAITGVVVIVAFVDWVFTPDDTDTFRWILLLIALGFGAYGASRRATDPHRGVGFVNAAGVALFALAATFLAESLFVFFGDIDGTGASFDVGWGWELVVLVGAGALIAYSVVAGQAGPGYVGGLNLIAFALLAAAPGEDGPSLIGWPLVLILVTAGLFALARGGARTT